MAPISVALFLKERVEKIFQDQVKVFLGFLGRSLCSFLCLNWFYSPRERERDSFLVSEMLIFERFIKETKRKKKLMRKYRWKSEETKESGIIHESIRVGKILVKIGFKVCVSLASLIIATKRMIFNQDVWHSPHLINKLK